MGSTRHRIRLLPDATYRCAASMCTFAGTSAEVTAHVRYGIKRAVDGSYTGPVGLTAASLSEMLTHLGLSGA